MKYHVDDIVAIDGKEFMVSAINVDETLVLIPLDKGLPIVEKQSVVSLIRSRIKELFSLKTMEEFLNIITGVETGYREKKQKKVRVPKEEEGEEIDI